MPTPAGCCVRPPSEAGVVKAVITLAATAHGCLALGRAVPLGARGGRLALAASAVAVRLRWSCSQFI